jgi:DnaK suppressor protein
VAPKKCSEKQKIQDESGVSQTPRSIEMKLEQTLKFKKLFEEQKATLLNSHKYAAEKFTLSSDETADDIDLTSAEQEQDMRMRLHSRETLLMKKIDTALERIQAGTFGDCKSCEEPIELSRLEVRPTAELCIHCKEAEEMRETRSVDGRKSKSSDRRPDLRIA